MKQVVHKLWRAYCGDGIDCAKTFHRKFIISEKDDMS
jgi:hypothetical protein